MSLIILHWKRGKPFNRYVSPYQVKHKVFNKRLRLIKGKIGIILNITFMSTFNGKRYKSRLNQKTYFMSRIIDYRTFRDLAHWFYPRIFLLVTSGLSLRICTKGVRFAYFWHIGGWGCSVFEHKSPFIGTVGIVSSPSRIQNFENKYKNAKILATWGRAKALNFLWPTLIWSEAYLERGRLHIIYQKWLIFIL